MKLPPGRLTSFLASPDPGVRAVLVFGPDLGMVRERAAALVSAIAGRPADPFRAVELPAAAVKTDPARLVDETLALCFGGGRRVVRLRDGMDGITAAVDAALTDDSGGSLIVIDAGDLPKSSSLRQLCERHPACAAIACYAEEGRALSRLIDDVLAQDGMTTDTDASLALTAMLGEDRAETRSQLEVLALYKGQAGTITLADVHAALGDAAVGTLEDLVDGAFGGDGPALVRGLAGAEAAGIEAIAMLRFASLHAQRLWVARTAVAGGRSADDAIKLLRPPVFFKRVAAFRRQMSAWSDARLTAALQRLCETEWACKTTGAPARQLVERALMELVVLRDGTTQP